MSLQDQEVVIFHVELFDPLSVSVKKFTVSYYRTEKTLQVVDDATKKNFLKKIAYPAVTFDELFIGGSVCIYGRLMHIVGYADLGTKNFMEKHRQRAFLLLRPGFLSKIGTVLSLINKAGYFIGHLKSVEVTNELLKETGVDSSSGVGVAIEAVSPASADWPRLWDQLLAQLSSALGSEAFFAEAQGAATSEKFFEGQKAKTSASFDGEVALALIKPHMVKSGKAGHIISAITEAGFEVSAIEQFHLDPRTTTEFLEVYKDIFPMYREMIEHFSTGPSIALQLKGENVVERFCDFTGPHEVETAKVLEPHTLRARFGVNDVKNAVHCTDLPEDGGIECRYFFQLLHAS